jgi:N-acetylneuraminic acid mutarotase
MNSIKIILLIGGLHFYYTEVKSQQPNSWLRVADFGGTPGSGGVSFSIDSFGYVGLGTYTTDTTLGGQYPTDFWQYNPYTNVWTQKASFPGVGRSGATAFVIGSKAYVGLGFNSTSQGRNDFWEYDGALDTWTQLSNFTGESRFFALGFSIGSKGYVGMGYSDTSSVMSDFWQYNPSSDMWTQLNDFSGINRLEGTLFTTPDFAYVGYGQNPLGTTINDFWRYDPNLDSWIQLSNIATGAISDTSVLPTFAFTIGYKGYLNLFHDSAGYLTNKNYFIEYNSITDQWIQKDSFSGNSLIGIASFSIGDRGYTGVGGYGLENNFVKDFWMYTPDSIATGIQTINKNLFTIYPNPTTDKIYINTSLPNYSISFCDMAGQSWPVILLKNEIDVSDLPPGIYCLQLQNSDGFLIRKFTKL